MPSKVWYVVENTREESVVVDGLGVLPPKTEVEFKYDSEKAKMYRLIRGMSLHQAHMPEGIEVSARVETSN